jgi:hypothetical protein
MFLLRINGLDQSKAKGIVKCNESSRKIYTWCLTLRHPRERRSGVETAEPALPWRRLGGDRAVSVLVCDTDP